MDSKAAMCRMEGLLRARINDDSDNLSNLKAVSTGQWKETQGSYLHLLNDSAAKAIYVDTTMHHP